MKTKLKNIALCSSLLFGSSLFADTLSIQNGYQIKSTTNGIDNVATTFNNETCIHSVWSYDTANSS